MSPKTVPVQPAERPDVDLRPLLGPQVLDQGQRPTCATFAASACHEAITARLDLILAQPSPQTASSDDSAGPDEPDRVRSQSAPAVVGHYAPEALWWYCHQRGWASANGLTVPDVIAALRDSGQPGLALWPYDPGLGAQTEDPPAPAEAARPWDRAELVRLRLAQDGVEAALEDNLAAGRPVLVGLQVTDQFYAPDADGRVELPDAKAVVHGGHAVTVVGAATLPGYGRHLLIKNSWGPDWGAGGYAFVPLDYLKRWGIDAAAPATEPV
ncbi:MAG: C1 family peptidase [Propionibacteriaceae bacterium]|nr:C1 family peptidase [Propionibacteriaceae bacterium]